MITLTIQTNINSKIDFFKIVMSNMIKRNNFKILFNIEIMI